MPVLPDPIEIRKMVGPKVCLVQADGPLGIPEAYASGFLLGAGRFVVTDLATVARGAERVTVTFDDGTSVVCDKFGMADPATGLVALAVPDGSERGGLSLSTASGAGEGGVPAVIVGWKYAESLELVRGRVVNGMAAAEVAKKCKIEPPAGAPTFLTVYAPAKPLATGAPAVDASGDVVGIVVHLRGVDPVVAVPAAALRQALLSAKPALKPLADLPRSVWPVTVDCLRGKPVTPQAFASSIRTIKLKSRCSKCRGSGKVLVKRIVGQQRDHMGMLHNIIRTEAETCRTCGGDGVVFGRGLYDDYVRMAEGITRLASDPAVSESVLRAAAENISSLLDALACVGASYRNELVQRGAMDLARLKNEFPHGVVVYAQCLETVREKGQAYTYLSPAGSNVRLLVAAEDLDRPLSARTNKKAARPRPGNWIILVGLARGWVGISKRKALYLEVFGWDWGPVLGPIPDYLRKDEPGERDHPRPQPPPRKKDGPTTFFGL